MVHICSFTNASVTDLKKSGRNENGVLYALKYHPRVSTWDMSEHAWLRNIIDSLEKKNLIVSQKEDYPWHRWELTAGGEGMITHHLRTEDDITQ